MNDDTLDEACDMCGTLHSEDYCPRCEEAGRPAEADLERELDAEARRLNRDEGDA